MEEELAQHQTTFTPYELYCEVQRMRVQMLSLCSSLDRVSQVLEEALKLPATQALEASLRGETAQPAQRQQEQARPAPPLDIEAWLRGAIKAVLIRAESALHNGEIRRQLHTVIEQSKYCAPSKQVINSTLHAMAKEGALWCEKRGAYNYWSLALKIDADK